MHGFSSGKLFHEKHTEVINNLVFFAGKHHLLNQHKVIQFLQ